ncbi:hypothetical protein Daesc_008714 [Daldinia eschscholtzii]|uniref:Uncharacterized protein n=1 Tax=Daldinia eschscholtzii TaxID=292717 RepID=A0AAX6MDC8_9PEZI
MERHELPKPLQLKSVLKPLSIDVPTPSPIRVTFAAVARDAETGAAVPPSPRTREQFYLSVRERRKDKRRARRTERIEEIKAELEAKRAAKVAAEEEKEKKKKKEEELRIRVALAEMQREVEEACKRAKKFNAVVGFGLDEGWYPSVIECMRAVYC